MRVAQYLILVLFSLFVNFTAFAQCSVNVSGISCQGNPLQFFSPASGVSTYDWNFNNEGFSTQSNPAFTFSTAGSKKVVLKIKFTNGSSCTDSVQFTVHPRPIVRSVFISDTMQCFTGNQFCFRDSSAVGKCIQNIKYLFEDGELKNFNNPSGVITICKAFINQQDRDYGYSIEITDCNGCITKITPSLKMQVRVKKNFVFTSNNAKGCDSAFAFFHRPVNISKSEVESFKWEFGDGSQLITDGQEDSIAHIYTKAGPVNGGFFHVRLTIKFKSGCESTYQLTNAAMNVKLGKGITFSSDTICIGKNIIVGYQGGAVGGATSARWEFSNGAGVGASTKANGWSPTISTNRLGPYKVNFTFSHPVCGNKSYLDTFVVVGPKTLIEDKTRKLLLAEHEKYQCVSKDTVHFINLSTFYHNDNLPHNDDSTFIRNDGLLGHVFDNNFNSVQANPQWRNDDNVFRIWDFDDDFAERCTTNTKLGLNVGKNCKYSADMYPVHFYVPWEKTYQDSFHKNNIKFRTVLFHPTTGCQVTDIDTTMPELHREFFYNTVPRCYKVTLYQRDTVHKNQCFSEDKVDLVIMPPKAEKLQILGSACYYDGKGNVNLNFDFSKGKPGCSQNIVKVNPDVLKDSANWKDIINIVPLPLYEDIGFFTPNANFSFDSSAYRSSDGKYKLGVALGNGVGSNACLDTQYYETPLKLLNADATFKILYPNNNEIKLCSGEKLIVTIDSSNKTNAEELVQSFFEIRGQNLGPKKNISYAYRYSDRTVRGVRHIKGDTTFYDLLIVERGPVNGPNFIVQKADTFVVAKLTKFDVTMKYDNALFEIWDQLVDLGLNPMAVPNDMVQKMLWNGKGTFGNAGTGARGCIDTSGFGHLLEYRATAKEGGRIPLHHRDSTLLPIDTSFNGADVFPNSYTFKPPHSGVYTFTYNNSTGYCGASKSYTVSVGFSADLVSFDSIFCVGESPSLIPEFRYYNKFQNGTPPVMDPFDWWALRKDSAGRKGYEGITLIDWSKADDNPSDSNTIFGSAPYGHRGHVTSIPFGGADTAAKNYYKQSGLYTLRVKATDSTGCVELLTKDVFVLETKAKFKLDINNTNCATIVELIDSSYIVDPFKDKHGVASHVLRSWVIDWGDGKPVSSFNPNKPAKIGHDYTRYGTFRILLTATSYTTGEFPFEPDIFIQCQDTYSLVLEIPGPKPLLEAVSPRVICAGDSVTFDNLSTNTTTSSLFIWNFGDSSFYTTKQISKTTHAYPKPGTYHVFLTEFDSIPNTGKYCSGTYPDTIKNSQPLYSVIVKARDTGRISADRTIICAGEEVTFSTSPNAQAVRYIWHFVDSNERVFTQQPVYKKTFNSPGIYTVKVISAADTAGNDISCPDKNTIQITVTEILADFEIDSTQKPNFCFQNKSVNAAKYAWGFYHDTDITIYPEPFINQSTTSDLQFCRDYSDSLGAYWVCLVAENEEGCKDTVCKLLVNDVIRYLKVYNVFTPGKDGLNDVFDLPVLGHVHYDLAIFNRWGNQVFASDNPSFDWNGKVNNKGEDCPDGTYFWVLHVQLKGTDKIQRISGSVTLIREK